MKSRELLNCGSSSQLTSRFGGSRKHPRAASPREEMGALWVRVKMLEDRKGGFSLLADVEIGLTL